MRKDIDPEYEAQLGRDGDVGDGDGYSENEVVIETPPKFQVCDEATANWLVEKIVEARARAQRATEWSERIKKRCKNDEDHLLFRFGQQLQEWTNRAIREARSKRKSVILPSGSVGYRKRPSLLVIDDERSVLAWARLNCPAAIVVSERLSRTAFNEHFTGSGELPDTGVHLEPEREVFFIR